MTEGDRPEWAERLLRERTTRSWTQMDVIRAMRTYSDEFIPDSMLDQYKRWERGKHMPTDPRHRALLAAVFGTVSDSLFGERTRLVLPTDHNDQLLMSQTGMDTLEILERIRRPSIGDSTLDGLKLTIEQLCCEYKSANPRELIATSRDWLTKMTLMLRENNLTITQHQEVLAGAGQLALLVGCLEYDIDDRMSAEATRAVAMQLGHESGNSHIVGWSHELSAWFALTQGNYRRALEAAQAGQLSAPNQSVAVQLAAQEAKAWARMGDQRNVMHALERGRQLLEGLPYPDRPENHFVVEPDKYDFYAMDCYRIVGENNLAAMHAGEVVRKGTAPDGAETSPMRNSEARITLGVVAARNGDLEHAVSHGFNALTGPRQSRPSLVMVSSELDHTLRARYSGEQETNDFHEAFTTLRRSA